MLGVFPLLFNGQWRESKSAKRQPKLAARGSLARLREGFAVSRARGSGLSDQDELAMIEFLTFESGSANEQSTLDMDRGIPSRA
jgi:hypothetical protein